MAFLPDDEEQQKQQSGAAPTLQGTAGPNVAQSSGAGPTSSPGAAPSSPWQNITAYLGANTGQAGKVADVLSGNLQNQYNTANQAIGQAQQNYSQQIEGARNPFNQDVATRAAASPSQFNQNPNDVAAFQKMYSGAYNGPQSFSGSPDYSNLVSQVEKGQKQASLVNQGTPGMMTLLQQSEAANGRNPSQGVTALDSLLLQEAPENYSRISAAAAPFAGLTDYLSTTQKGLDTAAQNAAKEAADTGSQLQGQFIGPKGVAPQLQDTLNQNLQSASKKAADYNTSISSIIDKLNNGQPLTQQESYQIDPAGTLQTLNPYGTGGGVFTNMLGQGFVAPGILSQYYNAPGQIAQPGLENVMTPEQLADAQALNQLLGQDAVAAPAQLGKAFTVPESIGSFRDKDALQGLYDSLQNWQSALPTMDSSHQNSWLTDMQMLASYLGQSSPYTGPGIQPVDQPQIGLGPNGEGPYLQPNAPRTGGHFA
jgi:hypothetical protein